MVRGSLAPGISLMLTMLFSVDSHSVMVWIFMEGLWVGARWRWVSRAFFRWWKSPSVSVYLASTWGNVKEE